MRVALLMEQALARVPGGTGRYSVEVARALAQDPSVDVHGWTAWHRDTRPADIAGSTRTRRLPVPRRPLAAAWERGVGPRPTGADLVHAPTLLVPPRGRLPLVVTIHDAVPWTHPETLTPRGVRWHRAMAERVARDADAVVVPTAAVATELGRHLALRHEPRVVGLGVTAFGGVSDPERRAAELGLPVGGYVLSLSTLEPRKGLDVLLGAMALPSAPDLPLVVVGPEGWGEIRLTDQAEAVGLRPHRLITLGAVSDADLGLVLARASVLVVPSRSEGFGLPVLEGMAAGTPVVTSDAPALVEVGGGATLVVPVGDAQATAEAMSEALVGRRADDLVARGRVRAAAFTWTSTAQQLMETYRSVT